MEPFRLFLSRVSNSPKALPSIASKLKGWQFLSNKFVKKTFLQETVSHDSKELPAFFSGKHSLPVEMQIHIWEFKLENSNMRIGKKLSHWQNSFAESKCRMQASAWSSLKFNFFSCLRSELKTPCDTLKLKHFNFQLSLLKRSHRRLAWPFSQFVCIGGARLPIDGQRLSGRENENMPECKYSATLGLSWQRLAFANWHWAVRIGLRKLPNKVS